MIVKKEIKFHFGNTPSVVYDILNTYTIYKISDIRLMKEQILLAKFTSDYGSKKYTRTLSESEIIKDEEEYLLFGFGSTPSNTFLVMYGCELLGKTIEPGLYMVYGYGFKPSISLEVTIDYTEDSDEDEGMLEEVEDEVISSEDISDVTNDYKKLIESMGVGYNYGNVYDAHDEFSHDTDILETYNLWGNTKINEEVINELKNVGFKTIRLPVTWYNHLDEDGKIREEWLEEIERAVDVILDADMYCILNIHHDTGDKGWLRADISKIDEMSERLIGLWSQISKYFRHYDHRLIFEGFNEILNSENQWSGVDDSCYVATQMLNQVFINTVRASDGYNDRRWLICNSYACNHDYYTGCDMVNSYLMPEDKANRILVQFHIYQDLITSIKTLDRIYARFNKEKVGVVIGEWGMMASSANIQTREAYAYGFAKQCKELGFHCCWWDDGGYNGDYPDDIWNFGLIGKGVKNVWWFKSIAEMIVKGWFRADISTRDYHEAIFTVMEYIRNIDGTDILDEDGRTFMLSKLLKLYDVLSSELME